MNVVQAQSAGINAAIVGRQPARNVLIATSNTSDLVADRNEDIGAATPTIRSVSVFDAPFTRAGCAKNG